ncbi:MAG: four helix bundle protein [Bacteroidetes bacterium]|jgi:four helix bundle protein|nr:four helix bundle protein [Bacteroidota bacterium]
MHQFKELKIWQRAIDLTVDVYKITSKLPKEEVYGLTSQMRKCAVSIPSNIAEGAGRNTKGEFNQFLGISNGSSYELTTQLVVASKLKLLSEEACEPILKELEALQKMTYKLQSTLK